MVVATVCERHEESGISYRSHLGEKPFRFERSFGPETTPANLRNGCRSSRRACSRLSRIICPRGKPDRLAAAASQSLKSSGKRTVIALRIYSDCNTSRFFVRTGGEGCKPATTPPRSDADPAPPGRARFRGPARRPYPPPLRALPSPSQGGPNRAAGWKDRPAVWYSGRAA